MSKSPSTTTAPLRSSAVSSLVLFLFTCAIGINYWYYYSIEYSILNQAQKTAAGATTTTTTNIEEIGAKYEYDDGDDDDDDRMCLPDRPGRKEDREPHWNVPCDRKCLYNYAEDGDEQVGNKKKKNIRKRKMKNIDTDVVDVVNHRASVILMSSGRSGSSVIWQALSNLAGYETPYKEYVGENTPQIQNFFQNEIGKDHPNSSKGKWMVQYLCWLRTKKYPEATFTGFKWKPYGSFSSVDAAEHGADDATREQMATLRQIAKLARSNESPERGEDGRIQGPPVRVLRSRRNPLDVSLSRKKHENNKSMGAHCKGDDPDKIAKCLKEYDVGKQTVDVKRFYQRSLKLWKQENEVDDLLREMNIPVAFVTYDTLFYPDEVSDGEREWNRALRFARGGPVRDEDVDDRNDNDNDEAKTSSNDNNNGRRLEGWKTWKDIQGSMKFAATTSSRNHKDLISNWEEVRDKFAGTPLEQYLRI